MASDTNSKENKRMIRAGIAGLGKWGQILVASVQDKSDLIRFTAGCTGRKQRAKEFCEANGIELRDRLDDLLGDADIDAVVLASPHSLHGAQIEAAAAAGKPVFVEKPFTLDRASAAAAVAACEKAGIVCAPGHNRRFLPAMKRLKEMVTGSEIGAVLHVEGNFSAGGALAYASDHWRASSAESPAGGMTGLGIHVIDALVSLLGPVAEVTAISERRVAPVEVDDTTFMTLSFESGVSGYFGTMFATARDWRLQVFGDKGWVEMRDAERLTVKMRDTEQAETTDFEPIDMERAELEAFARAIAGEEPFPVPLDDTVHGVAVLEAIVRSAESGRAVQI